jgi:ABC-type taurine transport system ATPase subunit
MISRGLEQTVNNHLAFQPAVALLGPRQVGKTTLAQAIAGAEMDLFIEASSGKCLALEIKLSTQPRLSKGFWSAHHDLKPQQTLVVAAVNQGYSMHDGIEVIPPWLIAAKVKQLLA